MRRRLGLLPLVVEAALWLLAAWLLLTLLSFPRLAALLRPRLGRGPASPGAAERVGRAVRAAAARVPWPAVCFPQGIAAQRMLCRRGLPAVLRYGVRSGGRKGLEAHVWVTLGDRAVIGGEAAAGFTEVLAFEARP